MLLIALLILIGDICVFAQYYPRELEFFQIAKENVEKINVNFSKILVNDLKSEENFIFSPLTIYGGLALIHLGATGTTKIELSNALGLPVDDNKFNGTAHALLGIFLGVIQYPPRNSAKINFANAVFIQQGLKVNDQFLRLTIRHYKSETLLLNFNAEGSKATDTVNEWIALQTNNRIPKLFDQQLPKNTEILLASALYFAGKWYNSFRTSDTETKSFNTGVKEVQVPTMRINESVPYFDNKDSKFQAISIPYLNEDFSMLIVLPYREQSLKNLINSFEPGKLLNIIAFLKSTYVNYEIPRMKFRWSRDINQHLKKLGLKQMFDQAELGKMIESKNIRVSKVTHAAEIEINEEGTVASAISAFQIETLSLPYHPNPPIPFHADRPFLFSIYHRNMGVSLFTGVMQNPTAENV